MRISTLVFGAAMACFLSVGDLLAATPKGKVDVDKALENAGRQYLFMRDELKGTGVFPKHTIQRNRNRRTVRPNGGAVASIPVLCFICMRKPVIRSCVQRENVC